MLLVGSVQSRCWFVITVIAGAFNISSCHGAPMIPIYLTVAGCLGLIKFALTVLDVGNSAFVHPKLSLCRRGRVPEARIRLLGRLPVRRTRQSVRV